MVIVCAVSFIAVAVGVFTTFPPGPAASPPKQAQTNRIELPGATHADVYWLNQHLELAGDTRTRYVQAPPDGRRPREDRSR